MKRIIIPMAVTLFLGACAISRTTYGPDGKQVESINCSGGALSWNQCFEKAGDLCGKRGYDVVRQIGEGQTTIGASGGSLFGISSHNRTLVVECKS